MYWLDKVRITSGNQWVVHFNNMLAQEVFWPAQEWIPFDMRVCPGRNASHEMPAILMATVILRGEPENMIAGGTKTHRESSNEVQGCLLLVVCPRSEVQRR